MRITSLLFLVVLSLSGCATAAVTGAVVGTAVTATKYAVKGTIGATKLVYRGGKAVVGGTARALSSDDPAPDIADDYNNLPDAN